MRACDRAAVARVMNFKRVRMVLLLRCVASAVALAVLPAAAQQAPAAFPPYKPVEVTLPAASADKGLEAFRKQLAAIVQRKDRAALARLVAAKDFFWEGDVGGMFNAKKSGFDNLNAALRLGDADSRGWSVLSVLTAEPTLGPTAEHPHARCAPAQPEYEDADLAALTDATNTDVADWSYPRANGLQVRNTAAADGVVIETLGVNLVRVLGTDRFGWTRVATPGGKTGFVAPGSLLSPLADRLCFGKDASGWRIVGYVGAGD
jgi:hypothetical protein